MQDSKQISKEKSETTPAKKADGKKGTTVLKIHNPDVSDILKEAEQRIEQLKKGKKKDSSCTWC